MPVPSPPPNGTPGQKGLSNLLSSVLDFRRPDDFFVVFPNEGNASGLAAGIELQAQFLGGRFLLFFVLTTGVLRDDNRKGIATINCRSTSTE